MSKNGARVFERGRRNSAKKKRFQASIITAKVISDDPNSPRFKPTLPHVKFLDPLWPSASSGVQAGLNRAILDQGWSMFRTMLAYKLADRGGKLVEVPAAYTSQTCPECGHVSAANRQSQADFVCVACCHAANADTNAAINILRLGEKFSERRADCALKPVEGHRTKRPGEAGTRRRKAA